MNSFSLQFLKQITLSFEITFGGRHFSHLPLTRTSPSGQVLSQFMYLHASHISRK